MAYKTRQEIFDIAFIGLRSQGFKRSYSRSLETCVYRGHSGRRCAIGWNIPRGVYRKNLEGESVIHSRVMAAASIADEDKNFALALQQVHDNATDPAEMEARLRRFAIELDLIIPA